jgi:transposase-like protein
VGPVSIQRPGIDERQAVKRDPDHKRFKSGVLARFLRRTPTMEGVVTTLYLKGLSTNDFDEALRAIYGEDAAKPSPSTVTRLKGVWHEEYEQWRKRKL